MKKLFILFLLGTFTWQQAQAQTEIPSGPLDLVTCVSIAIENNLTLKRSELNQLSPKLTFWKAKVEDCQA